MEARSRVALRLVAGAYDKWERVVRPHLLADRYGRIGRALQSSAADGDETKGKAFHAVFECELCSRLDRAPFEQLHREVSSPACRTAVLVVFDLHSEATVAWPQRSTSPS